MVQIEFRESTKIEANYLICDYNGTLAIDGTLVPGVYDLLKLLEKEIEIYVITADTFGKAEEKLIVSLLNLRWGTNNFKKLNWYKSLVQILLLP
jgi:soluble P-type ATPase